MEEIVILNGKMFNIWYKSNENRYKVLREIENDVWTKDNYEQLTINSLLCPTPVVKMIIPS